MATAEKVEIKVNVAGSPVAALQTLQVGKGEPRDIYFLEDPTPGLGTRHPLFDAGVVLRLRGGEDGGDSTVKLRPCRRSQLADRWVAPDGEDDVWEYRVEGDWTGERHTLAASLKVDLAAPDLGVALGDPSAAFDARQRAFLDTSASLRINPTTLQVFGPIAAERWKKLEIGGVDGVNAERWTFDALDFLELSIRVDAEDALTAQVTFAQAVAAAGLRSDDAAQSKTEQVLDALTVGP
jgi:hypothetical protein